MTDDETPDLSARTILVIDDEEFSRSMVVRTLKSLGGEDITEMANGVEALAHFDSADPEPDLLVVDIVMPEMGGVELLRDLAGRGFAGAVVIFSGTEDANMAAVRRGAEFRGLNVLGAVAKPVSRDALVDVLTAL